MLLVCMRQTCSSERMKIAYVEFIHGDNMIRYMGEYRDASIQKIKDALIT